MLACPFSIDIPFGRLATRLGFGATALALETTGAVALLWAGGAGAATGPPTPTSLTNCARAGAGGGGVSPDPGTSAAGEPNHLRYRFNCDTAITADTILVNRQAGLALTLDDVSPSADVFLPYGRSA